MSLLDNVRQTIGSAASSAFEMGQNLSAQAQAQLNIKKLQLEQAKKLHDLGARTYEWHKSGTLVATGTVPREVYDLCRALDDLNVQLEDQQRRLEEAKLEAELRASKGGDGGSGAPAATTTTTAIALPPSVLATPAPTGASVPGATAADKTTQILGDSMQTTAYAPTISTGITAGGPDITQPTIPVPGPDLPLSSPEIPTGPGAPNIPSNPDMPSPSQPTMPGIPAPGGPSMPPMPGQPSSPTM